MVDKAGSGTVEPEDFNALVDAFNEGGNGGSQPIKVVRSTITPATANIFTTGATLYTPAVGDVILDCSQILVSEAWDGDSPRLRIFNADEIGDDSSDIAQKLLGLPDGEETANRWAPFQIGGSYVIASAGQNMQFITTQAITVKIDDGAGGNPASTEGTVEVVLLIVKAS